MPVRKLNKLIFEARVRYGLDDFDFRKELKNLLISKKQQVLIKDNWIGIPVYDPILRSAFENELIRNNKYYDYSFNKKLYKYTMIRLLNLF